MKKFKIYVNGGKYNGAMRYYETIKAAIIAARRIIKYELYENVYIEISELQNDNKYKLIKTLETWR